MRSSVVLIFLIAFTSAAGASPVPGPACEHTPATAKAELSAIYGAEKAFHAEYESYTDGFFEIGYDPDQATECDARNWTLSIDASADSSTFLARARSKITGEEIVINESKELRSIKR